MKHEMTQEQKFQALVRFATECLKCAGFLGGEPGIIEGDDVLEDARKFGLVEFVEVFEPCGEECLCDEYNGGDFDGGVLCPRLAGWFEEAWEQLEE